MTKPGHLDPQEEGGGEDDAKNVASLRPTGPAPRQQIPEVSFLKFAAKGPRVFQARGRKWSSVRAIRKRRAPTCCSGLAGTKCIPRDFTLRKHRVYTRDTDLPQRKTNLWALQETLLQKSAWQSYAGITLLRITASRRKWKSTSHVLTDFIFCLWNHILRQVYLSPFGYIRSTHALLL